MMVKNESSCQCNLLNEEPADGLIARVLPDNPVNVVVTVVGCRHGTIDKGHASRLDHYGLAKAGDQRIVISRKVHRSRLRPTKEMRSVGEHHATPTDLCAARQGALDQTVRTWQLLYGTLALRPSQSTLSFTVRGEPMAKPRQPRRTRRAVPPEASFVIKGLHGAFDVQIPLNDEALVLIGPNGLGKSTIISCLYMFLTFQWSRLATIQFDKVEYHANGHIHSITRSQCAQYLRGPGSRGSAVAERIERLLSGTSDLDLFVSPRPLRTPELSRLSVVTGIPMPELERVRSHFRTQFRDDPDMADVVNLESDLKEAVSGQILFLPTYRRIEQDFRALFPRLLEQMRRYGDAELAFDRKTARYHEIIQFGMEDIQSLWNTTSASLLTFARSQLGGLMSGYLRDIIRGAAEKLDTTFFGSIEDADINKVLSRVEENALNASDQHLLSTRVKALRDDPNPSVETRYLGYFFQRLSTLVTTIEQRELRARSLFDTLNRYFHPAKNVSYDPVSYTIKIENDLGQQIDLGSLSSGEKQIVSLFSILYFGDASDHWIIIDEPELSLSVPWQETFLDDVYHNPKCKKLIAVTHSPFIYANSLRPYARDIVKYIRRGGSIGE